jgi:hypothetical protein
VAAPDAGGRVVFRVKWRAHTTSHSLNVPFREVAAHAVQKLFLEPHEWVVPPAATTCFSLKSYRAHVDRNAKPPFDGINCVFGVLSYWIEDAHGMNGALDEELFWQSRTYRDSLANVNLMSFLIDHGDSHPAQFVTTGDSSEPRVHLVDNTIAFSDFRNPSVPPEWDWSKLKVPALPRRSVERLAAIDRRDLERLHAIEQYANQAGRLVRKPTPMRLGPTESGMAWVHGDLVLGLDDAEIARLEKRVREVVARVGRGEISTF